MAPATCHACCPVRQACYNMPKEEWPCPQALRRRSGLSRKSEPTGSSGDELLRQYAGKWVALVGGQAVASGKQMNKAEQPTKPVCGTTLPDTLASPALAVRPSGVELVRITVGPINDDLRLRHLICGKASPFRRTCALKNLLRAGWKAEPSSLRGGGGGASVGWKAGGFPQGGAAEPRTGWSRAEPL
jgi:hypothetical protein